MIAEVLIMTKPLLLSFCSIAFAAVASAQTPAPAPVNPISGGEKFIYGLVSMNLIGAAQKMPEANYSFKPTPEVRSFGQLVGHAANAQYAFCSAAVGEKSPQQSDIEKTKTAKADLVQALKDAVDYCNKVYAGMTDADGAQVVKFFGYNSPKLSILSFNNAHSDEHYGNMVTYLRLKGIVPPSSETK
jgi:uncharacterized damage-inducible protein DinB